MDRHVALIGFMAAGKTSVGRRLAAELGLPFVDTDETIVAQHGPISEIFAGESEAGFREREFAAVRAALEGVPSVVALGGGAVTHEATRRVLAQRALRIFLDVPVEVVVARLRHATTVRPLLGAAPAEERVRDLLQQRLPFYREADIIVDCGRRSSHAVARLVAELVRAHKPLAAP